MLEYILLATCIVLQFTCIIQCCKAKDAAKRAEDAFARLTLSFSGLSARLNELEALIKKAFREGFMREGSENLYHTFAGVSELLDFLESARPGL